MARRTAALLTEGSYVNLGTGIPTLVSNYIQGRDITLHGENGILGYGGMVEGDQIDHDVFNASGQFVSALPGASFFDSVASFEMARSGKLQAVVLGAYQVDQEGNLANYSLGDPRLGGIGGAMDLVAGKQTLIVMMEHRDSQGRPEARAAHGLPAHRRGVRRRGRHRPGDPAPHRRRVRHRGGGRRVFVRGSPGLDRYGGEDTPRECK